jgi:hypothetical protein
MISVTERGKGQRMWYIKFFYLNKKSGFVPSGYRKRRKTNGDETVSKMHAHTRLCRNTVQERMMVS